MGYHNNKPLEGLGGFSRLREMSSERKVAGTDKVGVGV